MAIRDKITLRMKSGGKPHVSEVDRPGGTVDAQMVEGTTMIRVVQYTRKGLIVDWVMYDTTELRSVEFERGA
jgi:hypothetical protein